MKGMIIMTFKKFQALLCVATAVTTLCLAGCKQNEESPNDTSDSDSVSETLPIPNTGFSENSESEVTESYYADTADLDFHEFFELDESVEIVDNIKDKVFIDGFEEYKYHMRDGEFTNRIQEAEFYADAKLAKNELTKFDEPDEYEIRKIIVSMKFDEE